MPKKRGDPPSDGFDVKVRVTREHLLAFDTIWNADNRSKLIMHVFALNLKDHLAGQPGAPIRTEQPREEIAVEPEKPEVPRIDVDFEGDDQGF